MDIDKAKESPLSTLSLDLLLRIFKFVADEELLQCVCTQWYQIIGTLPQLSPLAPFPTTTAIFCQMIYAAPNQHTQEKLETIHRGRNSFITMWGGWHVTIGRTNYNPQNDDFSFVIKSINKDTSDVPWKFGKQSRSYKKSKTVLGVSIPVPDGVFKNVAIHFKSKTLRQAAKIIEGCRWGRVEGRDFHVTLGNKGKVTEEMKVETLRVLEDCSEWFWVHVKCVLVDKELRWVWDWNTAELIRKFNFGDS